MPKVDKFEGDFVFLSNFYPAKVELDGLKYPTVEHAYQAAKTTNEFERKRIQKMGTPGQAKKAGRHLMLRKDWDYMRVDLMTNLVRQKFENEPLRQRLLDTGDAELVEGNTWGDIFWGVCNGFGKNMLGKVLMMVRKELQHDPSK